MTEAEKPVLRAALRARRAAFVADHRWRQDMLVHTLFLAERVTARLGAAMCVSGYVSDGIEVDPLPILLAAVDRGLKVALPRVTDRAAAMTFHAWYPGEPLVAGPLGVMQPAEGAPAAAPDLILAPVVGFDRALNRLGQGAGFYDRAFAAAPGARRIGLAWSVQEEAAIPCDDWDVPLHGLATEREWIGA